MLAAAWQYLVAHPAAFGQALGRARRALASALALAALIAIPAGDRRRAGGRRSPSASRSRRTSGRTLPSLAVLALVMPILGTGFAPSLFALTLLALPPIVQNTLAGLRSVEPGRRRRRARDGHDQPAR
jgi:osmoprotectant transport system permease protein